jgi:hypothetical protein
MNYAIRNGIAFSDGNTCTTFDQEGRTLVYLHGNLISAISKDSITIYDGGYQSNTTKSRLNAILDEVIPGTSVIQRDFNWYIVHQDGHKCAFVSNFVIPIPDINSYSQSNLAALSNTEWGKSHLEVVTV